MSEAIDKIKIILDIAESNIDEVSNDIENQDTESNSEGIRDAINALNRALEDMPDPSDSNVDTIDNYPLTKANEYIDQVRSLLDEITDTATFDFNSRNSFADKYQMVNRQAKYISQDVTSGVEDIATNMLFNTASTPEDYGHMYRLLATVNAQVSDVLNNLARAAGYSDGTKLENLEISGFVVREKEVNDGN
jgi:hypothetical protein